MSLRWLQEVVNLYLLRVQMNRCRDPQGDSHLGEGSPAAVEARGRLAWVAAWRVIEMLKPTDKVSFGLMMSELPGCNLSER